MTTEQRGFVTYDELAGPNLDPVLWKSVIFPLPTGGEHAAQDPNAEVAVGEGEVRVTIPRFSVSSDTFQPVDSAKWVVFGTREFDLPANRPATFAADFAVKNIDGDPSDFRQGMAAFQLGDLKHTFSVISTSTRVFAMHEHLAASEDRFVHVTESPYEDFDDDFTRFRTAEVTVDRASSTVVWRVDGHQVYKVNGAVIPERMILGLGIWTQLPIRDGRSQSLRGQGLEARWRQIQVSGV